MTKKISPITFNGTSKIDELDDSIVLFDEPLQIVGTNERQWNGTVYDLNSTDAAQWDGIITQNHDSKLTDVIGKAIGLFKNKQGIFIRGIKYATEINPVAVLAKNLLTHGFAPGFSCETLGPDPDENGIWHNHVVCGLSQVVHPNDKMAYAVVSNSLDEAEKAGFDTTNLRKEMNSVFEPWNETFKKVNNGLEDKNQENTNIYYDLLGRKLKNGGDLSHQVLYNSIKDQINEGTNQMSITTNANKVGNPWHDEYGRFTFSPFGAPTYVGAGRGSYDKDGNYIGRNQTGYDINSDKATLTVNFENRYEKGPDGEYHHIEFDEMSRDEVSKNVDEAMKRFKESVLAEYDNRAAKKKEKQAQADKNTKYKQEIQEKLITLSKDDVEKAAKKYESQLRKANEKAEAKIEAGKDLRLADFATKTGAFSDDGNRFTKYAMNGTKGNSNGIGEITKHYSYGDTFLSGSAYPDSDAFVAAVYGKTDSVSLNEKVDSKRKELQMNTYVDDYNGVPTASVNYTDFYNKMITQIAHNQAISDLLNK